MTLQDRLSDRRSWARRAAQWLPLALIPAMVAVWPLVGIDGNQALGWIKSHHDDVVDWIKMDWTSAALIFMAAYALSAALSVPIATVATLTGGYLFGVWTGALLSLSAASFGAVAVFLIARTGVGGGLFHGSEGRAARMAEGFREDAFLYLLFLRLAPVFPFWLVNLVPAVAGVKTRTYVVASVLGMAPGSLVMAAAGDAVFWMVLNSERIGPELLLAPQVGLPLVGLGLLSLLPVMVGRRRRRRG